jgi:ATP phosphoribosyltransferase regulatory subunit HisZ
MVARYHIKACMTNRNGVIMGKQLLHTPEGVRDIYGTEYEKKLKVQTLLHKTIASYGYEDIQTPSFEFFDVFGNEIGTTPSRELYKFFDKEGNTLALRPDFTPSIARCAAKYFMDKNEPLRFSYLGNAFTNVSNLQGKLKETTQMGVELIGEKSVYADAEVLSVTIQSLLNAGLTDFMVSVGNVEYFKGLCEEFAFSADMEATVHEYISNKNFFSIRNFLGNNSALDPVICNLYNCRSKQSINMFSQIDTRINNFIYSFFGSYNCILSDIIGYISDLLHYCIGAIGRITCNCARSQNR